MVTRTKICDNASLTLQFSSEIAGERYSADKLTLSGDVGKKVKIGKGKSFVWDGLKDFPAGFEGDVTWDVEASSAPVAASAPVESSQSDFTDPRLQGCSLSQ